MGSPHWLGPWSFMQAKLHGGAGSSRPTRPRPGRASFATAGTVKDVVSASTTKDATENLLLVITGSSLLKWVVRQSYATTLNRESCLQKDRDHGFDGVRATGRYKQARLLVPHTDRYASWTA